MIRWWEDGTKESFPCVSESHVVENKWVFAKELEHPIALLSIAFQPSELVMNARCRPMNGRRYSYLWVADPSDRGHAIGRTFTSAVCGVDMIIMTM